MRNSYWTSVLQARINRRRALAATGATVAGAALLAACGSSGGSSSGGSTQTQSNAPLGQPKTGGIIKTWSTSAPDNAGLDTYLNWSGPNSNFTSLIYSKLTKLKSGPNIGPHQYVVDLDLASKVEQPDPLTYIFTINEKAKWQDVAPLNGRPITAQDVVWNINLWHQKGQNRVLTQPFVDTVEAVDAKTVKFKLKSPLAAFQLYIGHTGGPFIMPPELKENDQTREKTASSGAFILDKYDVGSALHYKRNPNYYKAPLPYADGLDWIIISDPSTVTANIRTGALDVALYNGTAPFQDIDGLKAAQPNYHWLDTEFINLKGWTVDLADKKYGLADERVRQAISVSLDREGGFAVEGPGTKYNSPLPVYEPWWLDPKKDAQLIPYYKRDIQKAKQLLTAAGFPDGIKGLPYMYNAQNVVQSGAAPFYQANMKDAGIQVQLTPLQQAEAFQKLMFGDAPGALNGGVGTFNSDPDEGLSLIFDPKSARNPITHKELMADDTKLLDLMQKIKVEMDFNKRKGYVDDVQRLLSQRMYVIGGIAPVTYYFSSKRLKNMNWVIHYAYGPIMAETWIDESS